MVASLLWAIGRVKSDVAAALSAEAITRECQALGLRYRRRVLDPATTVHAFLLQVLHGNTACAAVPRLAGVRCTGEAYCQARARLPLALFDRLLAVVAESLASFEERPTTLWRGRRVWLVDGSGCSMPDTPELQRVFGQPGNQQPGCGFPVAHLLALFDAGTGMLQQVLVGPLRTHDMARVAGVHPSLAAGDVLVADRGFCSYAHLALLAGRGVDGVLRVHQRLRVSFRIGRMHTPPGGKHRHAKLPRSRWVKRQGRLDQLVEYVKPPRRPAWITDEAYEALPASLVVREVRYAIAERGYRSRQVTLVTTLRDPDAFPLADLAQLYHDRWRVEVNLRHLKQTLKLDVLRSKTEAGVLKEVRMIALAYNLVRLVMLRAARDHRVHHDRVSFVDALRWLTHRPDPATLAQILVNPFRPGRVQPRVRKRRPKQYPLMNEPRATLKKRLMA